MNSTITLPAPLRSPVAHPPLVMTGTPAGRRDTRGAAEQYWLDDGARLVPVGVIDDGARWFVEADAIRSALRLSERVFAEHLEYVDASTLAIHGVELSRDPRTRSLRASRAAGNARAAAPGLMYALGTRRPLNFTLVAAAYSISRVDTGRSFISVNADEKLLLVRFTVHNTHHAAQVFAPQTLRFDLEDEGRRQVVPTAMWCTMGSSCAQLAPDDRAELTAAFVLPARAHVRHLGVRRDLDGTALEYALDGLVEPLRAEHADRLDPRGVTPLSELHGRMGAPAPLRSVDVRLEALSQSEAAEVPRSGRRRVTATVTVRNATGGAVYLGLSTLNVRAVTKDGREHEASDVLEGHRDTSVARTLAAGETARVRYVLELPAGAVVTSVRVCEGQSRPVSFVVRA